MNSRESNVSVVTAGSFSRAICAEHAAKAASNKS